MHLYIVITQSNSFLQSTTGSRNKSLILPTTQHGDVTVNIYTKVTEPVSCLDLHVARLIFELAEPANSYQEIWLAAGADNTANLPLHKLLIYTTKCYEKWMWVLQAKQAS